MDGYNRYQYVRGNPLRYTDPTGLCGEEMNILWDSCTLEKANYVPGDLTPVEAGCSAACKAAANAQRAIVDGMRAGAAIEGAIAAATIDGANAAAAIEGAIAAALLQSSSKGGVPDPKPGVGGGPGAGQRFPKSLRQQYFANENPTQTCVFCRRPGVGTELDHAIPASRGGNNQPSNAQGACRHCNASKGAGTYPRTLPGGAPYAPPVGGNSAVGYYYRGILVTPEGRIYTAADIGGALDVIEAIDRGDW